MSETNTGELSAYPIRRNSPRGNLNIYIVDATPFKYPLPAAISHRKPNSTQYIKFPSNYCCLACTLIPSWTGVATWRWVANDESCGICRMPFDGCCPDCKLPGDDCPLVWGQCTHCYHIHCIVKWLNSQQVQQLCPMCRREWRYKA